jgi:hypothetical protein
MQGIVILFVATLARRCLVVADIFEQHAIHAKSKLTFSIQEVGRLCLSLIVNLDNKLTTTTKLP